MKTPVSNWDIEGKFTISCEFIEGDPNTGTHDDLDIKCYVDVPELNIIEAENTPSGNLFKQIYWTILEEIENKKIEIPA